MEDFYFQDESSSEEDNNVNLYSYHTHPPTQRCKCNQINKQVYEQWIKDTSFEERYEAINNPKSNIKEPKKIKCKECDNLLHPCLAA